MEKSPMMTKEDLPVLVFATHNANKAAEVERMLEGRYRILTLNDIGCNEEIIEDATTLEGNAQIKARYVKTQYGLDCFADDTGLEVDALDGLPGVKTARYAGENADSSANMEKLIHALDGVSEDKRQARFRTCICLIQGEDEVVLKGVCEGRIALALEGTEGFGYDPIFHPNSESRTFAEMSPAEKNTVSHRGQAVRKMVNALLARFQ
jgi:XTP/dITP diphosphohydrolase